MKSTKVAEIHLIELDNPESDNITIDPMTGETEVSNPFMSSVMEIPGVIDLEYKFDYTNRCGLFITIEKEYYFKGIKKRIKALNEN